MTADEYRAKIKALGLTRQRPSYEGATVHADRDGIMYSVPDPEGLSPVERKDFVRVFMRLLGVQEH